MSVTTRRRGLWWWLAGIGLFILVPLAAHLIGWNVYNAVVWATGVVVFVYTVETHRMRAEMVRANTMEVQPVLVTRVEVTATPARGLVVANVGRGTALHVSIDDIEIELAPPGKDAERFTVRFATTDVVEPGQSHSVNATFGVAQGRAFSGRLDFLANLTPAYGNRDHEVILRYQDVEGRQYVSRMSMGKSGTRLVSVRAA